MKLFEGRDMRLIMYAEILSIFTSLNIGGRVVSRGDGLKELWETEL